MSTLAPTSLGHPTPADPERGVRLHVHVALAGFVLALLAPLLTWALFLADRHAPRGPWKRRLFALAIVDAAIVVGLVFARLHGGEVPAEVAEPPRLGVAIDPSSVPPGVRIARVAPGSPADRASLRDGDRVVAIDGRPVDDAPSLVRVVESTEHGAARRLTIMRDDHSFDVDVTPDPSAPVPSPAPGKLFEGTRAVPRAPPTMHPVVLAAGALDLLIVVGLVIAARRRGARAGPGLAVIAGLLSLTIVTTGVAAFFAMTVGVSLGAMLVSLLAGSTAVLVIGLVSAAVLAPAPLRIGPGMRVSKAVSLGVLYGVSGAARLAVFLSLAAELLHAPIRGAASAFGVSVAWGPLGVALFVATAVVIAPIGEELLFRGLLLPWLARWMRPAAAVAWSAVVFAFGHVYYGLGAILIGFYGLVLGWARLRTGSLWASIILHALLNGTTAAVLLMESSRQ